MSGRIKLSRTDVFLLVLTALFLLSAGTVYLLTPHTVREDYTVEALAPAEEQTEDKVNINTADAETLTALPGIGEVLAERIVAYRREYGPFPTVYGLMNVKGIGEKRMEAILDLITVGGTQ